MPINVPINDLCPALLISFKIKYFHGLWAKIYVGWKFNFLYTRQSRFQFIAVKVYVVFQTSTLVSYVVVWENEHYNICDCVNDHIIPHT